MTESSNLTSLTPNFITDSAGKQWSLVPSPSLGAQICYNGTIQTATANVALLLYCNHLVYHQNTAGSWYVFSNSTWTGTTDPRTAESADGTIVTTVGPIIFASQKTGTAAPSGPWNQWALNASAQIVLNGTVAPNTANVVALAYHSHTLYQHAKWSTGEGWWSWQTASSSWTQFNLTSVALSSTSYPANAPAGTVIAAVNVTTSDGSAFSGNVTVSDTTNFKIVGSNLVANAALTQSSYNPNVTATPVVGSAMTSTVTLTQSATSGGRGYLVGLGAAGYIAPNPAFHSQLGFYPDFTINNGYMGVAGDGYSLAANNGYPAIMHISSFESTDGTGPGGTTYNDPNAAANGSYNGRYDQTIANNIAPYASSVYAIRINTEWAGNWFHWSPYLWNGGSYSNPSISPATWVAAFQQLVNRLRANAATKNIKIAWDYPTRLGGASLNYYPGDAYVDIISTDMYFTVANGSNWNFYTTSPFSLNDMAAFASAHGKPMGFSEWADNFGDGSNITSFGNWLQSHNVVYHNYWYDGNWAFQQWSGEANAYLKAFSNRSYNGTFWPKVIPLPTSKPAGF